MPGERTLILLSPALVRVRDVCAVVYSHGAFVMSGQITKLKDQKRNRRRVNVYLDGRFAFGLAAAAAAQLRVGQLLSDEEIARLQEWDTVERATERAMDLLSYRPRSQAEVKRRLQKKGYEEEAIKETIGRLGRADLLDDREFARYWVENRFQFNPRGKAILRKELWQKGVNDSIIEDALADYDEEDAAARAAAAGIHRLRRLDATTFRRKLNGYLRRRGFPYAVIEPVMEKAITERALEESLERNEG